jgi:hypothetical protein
MYDVSFPNTGCLITSAAPRAQHHDELLVGTSAADPHQKPAHVGLQSSRAEHAHQVHGTQA